MGYGRILNFIYFIFLGGKVISADEAFHKDFLTNLFNRPSGLDVMISKITQAGRCWASKGSRAEIILQLRYVC